MPDEHRSQLTADHEMAIELAGVAARLDAIHSEVTRLANQVEKQNGRIGRLENERAGQQVNSINRTQNEISLDEWRAGVDRNIQSLRESRAGMRSTITTALAFVSCIGTLMVLGMMFWQNSIARDGLRHQEPAAQHQAVK